MYECTSMLIRAFYDFPEQKTLPIKVFSLRSLTLDSLGKIQTPQKIGKLTISESWINRYFPIPLGNLILLRRSEAYEQLQNNVSIELQADQ